MWPVEMLARGENFAELQGFRWRCVLIVLGLSYILAGQEFTFLSGRGMAMRPHLNPKNSVKGKIMKIWNSLALFLCSLISLAFLSGCGSNEGGEETSSDSASKSAAYLPKLVMATNAEFPPFEFKAEDGSFQGIDIEIMQAICKATGRELVVEDIAFDSIIPAVVSGKADCGVAGMSVTEDRLRNVDFTRPYYEAFQVIVVSKGSTIQGTDDLKGKRIGVQIGTTGDTLASDIEGADMNRFSKGADAITALIQNKVDAVVIDNEPAKAFVAKNADKLIILGEPLTKESYAMAVKKGNAELLTLLNTQIELMMSNGTMDAIRAKYEVTAE